MRFLVDENVVPTVARWLRQQNHDVFSVYEQARGMEDEEVIHLAFVENRILITGDKDFGEKVYRESLPHCGVILLRLVDERPTTKIRVIEQLIEYHGAALAGDFVVVMEDRVRFAGSGKGAS